MKIRVISLDGNRPRFSQYLLRWLFRIVDFSVTSWLCGTLSIALTDKGQRLGDLVAGDLTDGDVALIHEVIENYLKTGSTMVVYKMADKIREHLAVALPPNMNSMQFLQTVLKDYSHIAARADAL
eukprot:gene8638-8730_t